MAKNARISTIFSFFACFWLLTAIVPLYGAGSKEIDLSQADELIAEKEYDQAILVLTSLARRNPDQFDQAQARLNQIYRFREEFNKTADLLIENLLSDNPSDEVTLSLTTKLRTLENDNSPILVEFFARTHDIALFNVARNQLRIALESGREMLNRENFEGALAAYSAGFSIMRDDFYYENYGAAVHNQTREETERINNLIASFRQTSNQLESVSTELTRAVNSGQHQRVQEIMTRLVPAMDRFIAEKQSVVSATAVFERNLQSLQRVNPDMGDRNHLAFLIRVIYGRADQNIQEGILGAYDGFWKKSAGSSLNAITQYIENTNNSGLALFNRRNYSNAVNTLSGIAAYSSVTPVFFDKQRQLTQATAAQTVSFNGSVIQRDSFAQFLKLVSLYEASAALKEAAEIYEKDTYDKNALANLRARRITATEAYVIESRTRGILTSQLRGIEEIKTRVLQTDTQISAHQNFPYIKNAVSAIDVLYNTINAEELQSAQRYYTIAQADLEHLTAQRREELNRARAHMEGDRQSPALALRELTPMIAAANENITHGNTLLTQIRNESTGIASAAEIRTLPGRYQTSVNELISIRDQGQALANTAGGRAAQSEALRREGERLFAEAQAAFQRQNYDTAVDRIDRATQRLDESLAMSDSEEVRQFRDTQLLALSRQIAMSQNEVIITEVRNLVNSARDSYFAGNFQRAEENLLRARNRWRIVDTEENAEVAYWLSMVERAMSANTSRVVPATAPLYPEISQLLSQARRNYEEGTRLINAGRRAEGLAKFDEARIQTREVKLMYPVNQEAGILELRMEQFTDPAAFNAAFDQRMQTAIAGTKRRSLESYAEILNLAEINPRYPGIRNIITQAEIDMGLRPPPPDPAAVARSRDLTASARRILDQNQTAQFEIALTQINEAITLNPLNQDAPGIKDRLLNRMNTTEPGAVVLSSEDEALYQQAVRDFQAGNNLVAYANVERILQNPRNRNVSKVIELQRRIQAAL